MNIHKFTLSERKFLKMDQIIQNDDKDPVEKKVKSEQNDKALLDFDAVDPHEASRPITFQLDHDQVNFGVWI